ncbi:MAG: ribonuclease P protein component [Rickettsiales bacterium]|jgi:ribonuclease P protein component|nr:ribonuclease P protein component [Rickettsiales bacterium]
MKFIRYGRSSQKLVPLKSRRGDFWRINPRLAEGGATASKKNRRFISSTFFTVHYAHTKYKDKNFHIGFTASIKSVSKLAIRRNYAKRLLRAAINENIRDFPKLYRIDSIWTAKRDFHGASYPEFSAEIRRALERMAASATKHRAKDAESQPEPGNEKK